jgi:subtilisin family serine protease
LLGTSEFGTSALEMAGARESEAVGDLRVESAELSRGEVGALRHDPSVLSFAQDMPVKLHAPIAAEATDEEQLTWGVEAVAAHTSPFEGAGVTVAVLDTGIDPTHPAFQGVELLEKDFTGEGNGDKNGHGTHCAGTIFGRAVDGLRIGVAPGIRRALIGKVLDGNGRGSTEGIVRGIQWALDEGANLISMSLGMDFPGLIEHLRASLPPEAATSIGLEAYRANVNLFGKLAAFARSRSELFQPSLIIAASGNESARPQYEVAVAPPAVADDIQSVGALGEGPEGLEVARFSNTKPDLCGPGVGIRSAQAGGGLRTLNGTSMATPHVVGVAALWADKLIQSHGGFWRSALAAKLVASGTQQPLAPGFDPEDVGAGLVQAPQS